MALLTLGEWRLYLLSDCIKKHSNLYAYTEKLRSGTKQDVLNITQADADELDMFIIGEWATEIRKELMTEWKFSGQVVDNGKHNKTICQYCQRQHIRYKYLCVNQKNRKWLELGSVCVGNVVYGEERMKDKGFADQFVGNLDKLRKDAISHNPYEEEPSRTPEDHDQARRDEQFDAIQKGYKVLRMIGWQNTEFVNSICNRWDKGKSLTDGQFIAWKNMCRKAVDKLKAKQEREQRALREYEESHMGSTTVRCGGCCEPYKYIDKMDGTEPDEITEGMCKECLAIEA